METRLVKLFPGIRQFFVRCQNISFLDGKVWIPQIPDTPPKFTKTAEPSRTLLHSISEQPIKAAPSTPTLKRNVSSRIAALQKAVVIPRNKLDIETKPLPPIPNPSTSNNRQVYEDDDNIYEELDHVGNSQEDDEYFTDSDFDTTDDEYDEAAEIEAVAAKDKFKRYYEGGDFADGESDPRAMLQKVLVNGIRKGVPETGTGTTPETSHSQRQPERIPEEAYDIPVVNNLRMSQTSNESRSSNVNEFYEDVYGDPGINVIDVAELMSQIQLLKEKVDKLERANVELNNQNQKLLAENAKLKNTKNKPPTDPKPNYVNGGHSMRPIVENKRFENESSPFLNENGQRKNLRDSVAFFESIQK